MDTAERLLREAREALHYLSREHSGLNVEDSIGIRDRIDAYLSSTRITMKTSNELLREARDTLDRIAEYTDHTGAKRALVKVKTMARAARKYCDLYLSSSESKQSATIDRVMNKALRRSVEIVDAPPAPTVPEEPSYWRVEEGYNEMEQHPQGDFVMRWDYDALRSLLAHLQEQLDHERSVHEVTVNDRERLREHFGSILAQREEKIGELEASLKGMTVQLHRVDAELERMKK